MWNQKIKLNKKKPAHRRFFIPGEQVNARKHLYRAKKLLAKVGIRMWDFEVRRLEQTIGLFESKGN